jgi:hypothetical protein
LITVASVVEYEQIVGVIVIVYVVQHRSIEIDLWLLVDIDWVDFASIAI